MASPLSPFTTTVYSKSFAKLGTIGAPQSLTVTPRHNQQPTAQLVLPVVHPRLADLMTEGARVLIQFGPNKDHLLSGPVDSYSMSGPRSTSTVTFQIVDDWWLLGRMLGWPNPGSAIGSQTVNEYDTRSGAAETVFKGFVSANKGHLSDGSTVTVASDAARGTSITVANRFHPLTERLIPAVDTAGVGTTVRQSGSGLVVDCYAVRTYPRTLSEASRVVQDWTVTHSRPKATRVVVGGQGDGTARAFRLRTTSALESLYGYTVEAFRDATDATTSTDLDARGDQYLAENVPTNGISVTLSQTSTFRYDPTGANGVRVGDLITFQVGPGVSVTDVLRSCTLTWSSDQGFTVTPQVGERTDDPSVTLGNVLTSIRRSISNLRR